MRNIGLSLILICFVLSATGQKTRLSICVNPAINWLNTNTDDVISNGAVFGMSYGLDVDYFFTERYAFATGFKLQNIGSGSGKLMYDSPVPFIVKDETQLLDSGTSMRYNTHFLEIPLGLRLSTVEIGYVTFYGQIGLNALFNIKATGSAEQPDSDDFNNQNIIDEVRLFNVGYNIGGGIQYSLGGQTAIIAGIAFTSTFTDMTVNIETQSINGIAYSRKSDFVGIRKLSLRIGLLF